MKDVFKLLFRNKRYIALALGGLVLSVQYLGIDIPGEAPMNSDQYLTALKDALMALALAWVAHHDGTLKSNVPDVQQ
jgi:hypothetical protein